ncbi:hypothetical protein Q5752_003654 [Cryptotrichosporon argae]
MDPAALVRQIPQRRRLALALLGGAALRLALFATALPGALERRPELTSPLTSFRSLKEGVWLSERGVDPYAGGVFYHSPLYLFWFTHVVPPTPALTAALWTLLDVATALALVSIWRARRPAAPAQDRDALVALLYLLNPYTLLTCLARSTTAADSLFTLTAIALVLARRPVLGGAALAVAAHTALYPVVLLPPLVLCVRVWARPVLVLSTLAGVFGIEAVIRGAIGDAWIKQTWGTILTVSDLTPNVGMWWYFFTEMFDHFRPFFIGVFQLHTVVYVAPVCVRLAHDPPAAALVLLGVLATWKSYPTLGDMAAYAGLLGCFPELVPDLKHPKITLITHLYTALLLPLLHSLWLGSGTGNANFFYAATMVYGLNNALGVADVLGAMLARDARRRISAEVEGASRRLAGEGKGGVEIVGKGDAVAADEGIRDDEALRREWEAKGWEVVQLPSLG